MKKRKRNKLSNPVRILLHTVLGIAVFFGVCFLCAYFAASGDHPLDKYRIFLLTSSFAGALPSSFLTARCFRSKRLPAALLQGIGLSVPILMIVAGMNSFAVSASAFLIIPCCLAGGLLAGIAAVNVR